MAEGSFRDKRGVRWRILDTEKPDVFTGSMATDQQLQYLPIPADVGPGRLSAVTDAIQKIASANVPTLVVSSSPEKKSDNTIFLILLGLWFLSRRRR